MILPFLSGNARVIGFVAVAFFAGAALGNFYATQRAVGAATTATLNYAAQREAAVGKALIDAQKQFKARVEREREQEQQAQQTAYNLFQDGMEEAAEGRATAERKLSAEFEKTKQLTENRDALLMVNKMLAEEFPVPEPPRGCVFSSGVRNAINAYIESINNRSAVGDSPPTGSSVPDGSNSASAVLECERLAYFVTEILEHDALLTAWLLSFQEWERAVASQEK